MSLQNVQYMERMFQEASRNLENASRVLAECGLVCDDLQDKVYTADMRVVIATQEECNLRCELVLFTAALEGAERMLEKLYRDCDINYNKSRLDAAQRDRNLARNRKNEVAIKYAEAQLRTADAKLAHGQAESGYAAACREAELAKSLFDTARFRFDEIRDELNEARRAYAASSRFEPGEAEAFDAAREAEAQDDSWAILDRALEAVVTASLQTLNFQGNPDFVLSVKPANTDEIKELREAHKASPFTCPIMLTELDSETGMGVFHRGSAGWIYLGSHENVNTWMKAGNRNSPTTHVNITHPIPVGELVEVRGSVVCQAHD